VTLSNDDLHSIVPRIEQELEATSRRKSAAKYYEAATLLTMIGREMRPIREPVAVVKMAIGELESSRDQKAAALLHLPDYDNRSEVNLEDRRVPVAEIFHVTTGALRKQGGDEARLRTLLANEIGRLWLATISDDLEEAESALSPAENAQPRSGGGAPAGEVTGINLRSGDARSGDVTGINLRSDDVRSGDVTVAGISGDVAGINLRSGDARSGDVTGVNVHSGDVRSGDVTGVNVHSGDVRSGDVTVTGVNVHSGDTAGPADPGSG